MCTTIAFGSNLGRFFAGCNSAYLNVILLLNSIFLFALICLHNRGRFRPNNFIELYRSNRISSSYLHYYRGTLPFWLAKELDWHLYDKDYIPSFQEREAAKIFLENHYHPINQSNINLLVGTSAVSAIYKIKRPRWNPRGVRNDN